MANMAMAQAVMEHAERFYNVDQWYVVAEAWDVFSVQEELTRYEDETAVPFELETAAIGHFAKIACPKRNRH
jgi:putative transposon-encoded protein